MKQKVLRKTFKPRGNCAEIFRNRKKELILSGPAGTGKSRACLEKIHAMCLLNPGMRALIVRQTAVSLSSTVLNTWKQWVAAEALATEIVVWYGGSKQEPSGYRYENGSFIAVGGMDNPMKIMSSEYDLIYVAEATELTLEGWEMITTRLRNGRVSFQQLLADCNPNAPTHWLKGRADEGRAVMLSTTHLDNPRLYDDEGNPTVEGEAYMELLDNLTGVRKLRLKDGLWVGAEGQIYDEFDEAIHVLNKMPVGWEKWDRYWSIDFGTTNPFVLQCWAEDGDGRLYLYREIYMTKTLVEDHAKNIMSIVAPGTTWSTGGVVRPGIWIEPKPRQVICDHDLGERMSFEKYTGLRTEPAHKDVIPGIEATQVRYRRAADGKPRIYFLKGAIVKRDPALVQTKKPCDTVSEIPGYVWDGLKEKPVKENDHGQDAKRYIVAARDIVGGGVTKIRTPRRGW
jgi:phage terminase large subunit